MLRHNKLCHMRRSKTTKNLLVSLKFYLVGTLKLTLLRSYTPTPPNHTRKLSPTAKRYFPSPTSCDHFFQRDFLRLKPNSRSPSSTVRFSQVIQRSSWNSPPTPQFSFSVYGFHYYIIKQKNKLVILYLPNNKHYHMVSLYKPLFSFSSSSGTQNQTPSPTFQKLSLFTNNSKDLFLFIKH